MSDTQSDTPRTDEQVQEIETINGDLALVVSPKFARILEREIAKLKDDFELAVQWKNTLESENAKLKEYHIDHATCHGCPCKNNFDLMKAENAKLREECAVCHTHKCKFTAAVRELLAAIDKLNYRMPIDPELWQAAQRVREVMK